MSVSFVTTLSDQALVSVDASCSSAGASFLSAAVASQPWVGPWSLIACTADPVVVGTGFLMGTQYGVQTYTIQSLTMSEGTVNPQDFQTAIAALRAELNTTKAQVNTLSTALGSTEVNPEVIQASSLLFAAVFTAAAIIWGVKKIYSTINHASVGHE